MAFSLPDNDREEPKTLPRTRNKCLRKRSRDDKEVGVDAVVNTCAIRLSTCAAVLDMRGGGSGGGSGVFVVV